MAHNVIGNGVEVSSLSSYTRLVLFAEKFWLYYNKSQPESI